MSAQREPFDWNAWMWWTSLTALSTITAMIMVVYVIVGLGLPVLGIFDDEQTASMALQVAMAPLFALAGAIVGLAQWLILRGQIQRAGWWVLATAGGWMAGYLWSSLLFPARGGQATFSEVLFPWLLNGLMTGLCQWLILRNFYHRSALWVLTAALAMGIGTTGWLLGGTFGGTFLWLVAGALSGWILLRTLPRKPFWPEQRGSGPKDQE
jgi:hypothetical protein